MFTTIITDCWGENEKGRQIARYNSLGLGPTDLIGISSDFSNDATIEGGADVIDIIDASAGKKGNIILNVAPRGNKKDGGNGTHFAYYYYKSTLLITTVKAYCLSFIKKFDLVNSVQVVELSEVLNYVFREGLIDRYQKDYIVKSQFRSFDFVPKLARWLADGVNVPSDKMDLKSIPMPPDCIWHIDAFGNAKTSILSRDVGFKPGEKVKTNFGTYKFYLRLKDVPQGETAIYVGSSGFEDGRFLEIATQGIEGSAADTLKIKTGDPLSFI